MGIGIGHELIGFFGCRIEADRMIYRIIYRKRHFLLGSVYRRAGRKNQVAYREMAAGFQYMKKSYNI